MSYHSYYIQHKYDAFTENLFVIFNPVYQLSDGIAENQSCMYTGTEPQPDMIQYCSIKVRPPQVSLSSELFGTAEDDKEVDILLRPDQSAEI